ncbi:MAG: protein kinase, partial [Chloroflexota bacterium]
MANDNLIGTTVNGYEIVGTVGRGGMATVYKAHQISMNRTVALKVLPRQFVDDTTYIQRFKREVDIVSRLEHRAIVPVYDYGEHERQPYIVMRYMPAGSVDGLLTKGAVPMEQIIKLLEQVAPALDYAHTKNVLHRDLKPSNVLMDDGGGAYLTDFGIARILGEASGGTITTQGVVGTPAYMSPEQAQGRPLDGRSDVYALGVMLFEMATGRRPFHSETPYGVAVMQVTTPPPSPRALNPALPPAVESVIFRSMAKDPDERFQSAVGLVDALDSAWNAPPDSVKETVKRSTNTLPSATVPSAAHSPPPSSAVGAPAPYGYHAAESRVGPRQSAWMPPVDAPRKRRRRGMGAWASLLVGGLIGCALLTALLGAGLYWFAPGVLGDLLTPAVPTATEEEAVTPGSITIIGTPPTSQPTRTPSSDGPTPPEVRIFPSNTPFVPTAVVPTATAGALPTATVAPIGVRPDTGAIIEPTGEVVYFTEA